MKKIIFVIAAMFSMMFAACSTNSTKEENVNTNDSTIVDSTDIAVDSLTNIIDTICIN